MKICSKCKENKELNRFHKNRTNSDGLQAQCIDCKSIGNKIYVENNYEKYKNYHKSKYNTNYEYICSVKKNCIKCGENRFWVLDFHHLDPLKKERGVSDLLNNSLDRLKQEVEKCITLCRNCHSDFHYLEKLNNINIEDYLK